MAATVTATVPPTAWQQQGYPSTACVMIVDSISEQSWQLQHNFKKKFWQPHNTDAEAYLPKHDCSGSLYGNII